MALLRYDIPYQILEGAGRQGIKSATRPWCAAVSALASGRALARVEDIHPVAAEYGIRWEHIDRWVLALEIDPPRLDVDPIPGIDLDQYQYRAIEHLTCAGGVMALGCGLGKTRTSVVAAITYLTRGASPRCYIACPLNAIPAWEPWVQTLKDNGYEEVEIISIDSLHKIQHAPYSGGVVIWDEAHLLGNATARRTKAAHELRKRFDVGICLTGTMLHAGIEKVLSILDLAIPGAAWFSSKWNCGAFFRCLTKHNIGSRKVTKLEKPTGKQKQQFFDWVSRYAVMLNSQSEEVRNALTIPEQHLYTVRIGNDHDRSMVALVAEYANHIYQVSGEMPSAQETAVYLARSGIEEKVDWVFEQMDGPSQVVMFARYTDSLDAAEEKLKQAGITYVRVDGSIVGSDRSECERKFRDGKAQVFLGQMDAACVSMNLQTARVSVALDHTWSGANYAQALARTCRRGQDLTCHHFDLSTNRFQTTIIDRLRSNQDFNSEAEEYQELKNILRKG